MNDVFSDNEYLFEIKLPTSVTHIEYAFRNCNLKSLDLSHCTNLKTIGNAAFYENKQLTKIKLPVSITEIGEDAFKNCNLKSLDLSGCTNLTEIRSSAFAYNEQLAEINLPLSISKLGGWAFYYCGIRKIDLSRYSNLEIIDQYAFDGNFNAIEIILPPNVKEIGMYAFWNILIPTLEIPATIEYIGIDAFAWYHISLCKLNATTPPKTDEDEISPDMVLLVPERSASAYKNHYLWGECQIIAGETAVEITVSSPGNLAMDIVDSAFVSPASVTHLTVHGEINGTDFGVIRSNMTNLMHLDLTDAKPIQSITPADSIISDSTIYNISTVCDTTYIYETTVINTTTVCDTTFTYESVVYDTTTVCDTTFIYETIRYDTLTLCDTIPVHDTVIHNGIAYDTVYNHIKCTDYIDSIIHQDTIMRDGIVYDTIYQHIECTNYIDSVIRQDTIMYDSIVYDTIYQHIECTDYTDSITLRDTVMYDGIVYDTIYQFIECIDLVDSITLRDTTIIAADTVFGIPYEALEGKHSLLTLRLPRLLHSIGDNAFRNCKSLSDSIVLPKQLNSIGYGAFAECVSLPYIGLNDSLNYIGNEAFYNCSKLTTLQLPQRVQYIGSNAFYGCSDITDTVVLPAQLTDLSDGVFYGCTSLTAIVLPDSLRTIGYGTFYGCSALGNMQLPTTLTRIGGNAFYGCTALTSLSLPKGMNYIGEGGFAECRNISEIGCSNPVPPSLGDDVFKRVDNETCLLSIPTNSFRDYMLAQQWGAFVQMRESIDVSTDDRGGDITVTDSVWNYHAEIKPLMARAARRAAAKPAPATTMGAAVYDGASVYVKKEKRVTFFITPKENYDVKQVLYNGNDVTGELRDGAYSTPAVSGRGNSFEVLYEWTGAEPILALDRQELTLTEGETANLTATISPANYPAQILWKSLDNVVANVTDNGLITALSAGTVEIIAYAEDGSCGDTCHIIVNKRPETAFPPILTIEQQEITLQQGDTYTLVATFIPTDYQAQIVWKSTNRQIVNVDGEGNITALTAGTADIIASAEDGSCADICHVTVKKKEEPITPTLTIDRQELTITEGETATLSASIMPADYPAEIEWESSDDGVAEVDSNGCITAIVPGEAEIIASASDGSCTDTCHVTVEKKGETAVITTEEESIEVWAAEDAVTVHGVPSGERVTVYTVSGQAVATAMASGGDLVFLLPRGAVYIVVTESAKPTKVTL